MYNKILFELNNVSYSYLGRFNALKNISLKVVQGERIAILGANGAGKSTLLKLMDALNFPTSGSIKAFGRALTEKEIDDSGDFTRYFRKKVGLLFQNPDIQLFSPTVFDEIAFGPLQLDMGKDEVRKRVGDVLDMLDIGDLVDRSPYQLSGGERKKVAIATILVVNPDVLLLDEPTSNLDPKTKKWFITLLNELNKIGKTIITATHDMQTVTSIADRFIVLSEEHTLVADGPSGDILEDRELLLRTNLI
ncbi:MAG TPA: ABC transporter ATP-binding protein [Euryarchaeota archaeon]|nr:nickel import ATP-binding protein NikO [archaeon BMS3Bbin15]HDL15277.1 ABC transporter ATP-binding protein [Euryarchaeota archaeon]